VVIYDGVVPVDRVAHGVDDAQSTSPSKSVVKRQDE